MNAPENNGAGRALSPKVLPTGKADRPGQATRARRNTRPRALCEGEAGLGKAVRQINKRIEAAGGELEGIELTASDYVRLVALLVRIVEAGLKCEKQRMEQKEDPKCMDQPGLSTAEERLNLL